MILLDVKNVLHTKNAGQIYINLDSDRCHTTMSFDLTLIEFHFLLCVLLLVYMPYTCKGRCRCVFL